MKKVLVAYVPVLHEGYRKFFEAHSGAVLYIFGKSLVEKDFPHLGKEIRALDPKIMKTIIESLQIFEDVKVLDANNLLKFQALEANFILPDEDVSIELAEKYLKSKKVIFEPVFLRLDKHKSMEEKPVEADQTISRDTKDHKIIELLKKEAEKSSDWWRRIGAAVVKDEKVILIAHNKHLPSEHSPYSVGDPRNNFHKGLGVELSTSFHSEAALISEAARKGVVLLGTSMYVTIFPCPPCAKLIANSGIKKLYYAGGYVLLDQDKILKSAGVEIIYVETKK